MCDMGSKSSVTLSPCTRAHSPSLSHSLSSFPSLTTAMSAIGSELMGSARAVSLQPSTGVVPDPQPGLQIL